MPSTESNPLRDEPWFQVEEILPGGLVTGRNGYVDIPVGSTFTWLRISEFFGELDDLRSLDFCPLDRVSLRVDKVEVFRQSLSAIPRGYSAGVHLSGEGLEVLVKALSRRRRRVYVNLHL